MNIRNAQKEDAQHLYEIELENYGEEESTELATFSDIIEYPQYYKGYSLVVLEDKVPVGFYCTSSSEETDGLELQDIAVLKKEQGNGYGKQLLQHCLNDNPNTKISLIVRADNISAISLYKSFNFQQQSIVSDYYDDCDGIRFVKE